MSSDDDDPQTVLHEAAYEGDLSRVKKLIWEDKQQKKINVRNRLGCTPLRLAATAGHTKCVKYLLDHGADINIADVKAQTPLFVAVKNKRIDCLRELLKYGADPSGNPNTLCAPLYNAAMDGFLEGVKELINYNADLDNSKQLVGSLNRTPLYISIAYHHLECFRVLLYAGADPNFAHRKAFNQNPVAICQCLYHAIIKHNVEIEYAQLLYNFGANLYCRDEKGRLPCECDQNKECKQYIKSFYVSVRPLLSFCRLVIRAALSQHNNLREIGTLPLPPKLVSFLKHETVL